jgi:hypothetical protein
VMGFWQTEKGARGRGRSGNGMRAGDRAGRGVGMVRWVCGSGVGGGGGGGGGEEQRPSSVSWSDKP